MSTSSTSSRDSLPLEGGVEFNMGDNFYSGAHGFHIGQQNNIVNHYGSDTPDLVSTLRPIPDASYTRNRKLSPPDSACLPGTRHNLIKRIKGWGDRSIFLGAHHVMWIHGYVGCGKSSLSQAVAERYAEKERLLGSFFFFRGAGERNDLTRFAATIACQLAAAIPKTAHYIEKALKTHPGLLTNCTVDVQFQHLVYKPLIKVTKLDFRDAAYIIVLDGLDECEDHNGIASFVDHMLRFFEKNPRVPLRFFITSRIEEHLRTHLQSDQVYSMDLVDHTSLEDVSAVADATFALAAKHDRVIQAYGKDWPSPADRLTLAKHADGSLVFMSTILKFILGPGEDGLTPMQRLPLALNITAGLDGFYTETLSRSEALPHFFDIIATIMVFAQPPSVTQIASSLGVPPFEVVRVLVNLHAILQIPGDNQTPVSICHTSLRDFLYTEERSGRFYLSTALRDGVYRRAFACGEHSPRLFDIIATITLAKEPVSALQIAGLLSCEAQSVLNTLGRLAPIFCLPTDVAHPIALPSPVRDFLEAESRSRRAFVPQMHHERLAYGCFKLVSLPPCGAATAYARTHAVDHWKSFLAARPDEGNVGEMRCAPILLRLRELFSNPTVDIVVAVVLAMEHASHGLPSTWSPTLLGQILHSRVDPDHTKLVAEVLLSLSSSRDYPNCIISSSECIGGLVRQASIDDVQSVARAVFALATQNTSPSLNPWNWGPVDVLLHSLVDLYGGSLIFACHFIGFTLDLERGDGRLPLTKGASDNDTVDTTLDDLFLRVLTFSEHLPHFHRIVSTISLLQVPLTICQLSDFLSIPISTIRVVLVRLRGITHVPLDNRTDVTFSPSLCRFVRDGAWAGHAFAGSLSSHGAVARRCRELLEEKPRRGSNHPRSLAAYARNYGPYHQRAPDRILRRSTT